MIMAHVLETWVSARVTKRPLAPNVTSCSRALHYVAVGGQLSLSIVNKSRPHHRHPRTFEVYGKSTN